MTVCVCVLRVGFGHGNAVLAITNSTNSISLNGVVNNKKLQIIVFSI